jgi:hypothetical protein
MAQAPVADRVEVRSRAGRIADATSSAAAGQRPAPFRR